MNTKYRKPLAGTQLEYYDVRQAVEDIQPGAYEKLPYTSKVLAEQLVRRADAENLTAYLTQLIERRQDLTFLGTQRAWCVMTFWVKLHWLTLQVCVMQLPTKVVTHLKLTQLCRLSLLSTTL